MHTLAKVIHLDNQLTRPVAVTFSANDGKSAALFLQFVAENKMIYFEINKIVMQEETDTFESMFVVQLAAPQIVFQKIVDFINLNL